MGEQSNNYLSTVFVEENNVAPVVDSKADLRSEIQVKYVVYFFPHPVRRRRMRSNKRIN